jgi:CcmD family protein
MYQITEVPNTFPDLFWGYTFIWLLLSLYILYLGVRVRRLEKSHNNDTV